ncbi:MAG: hypothetical protein Q9188_000511 [Gyalolechia gomerana]
METREQLICLPSREHEDPKRWYNSQDLTRANGKDKENIPAGVNTSGQSTTKNQTTSKEPSSSGADGAAAKGKAWDKSKQDTWLKCLNDHR